MSASTKQTQEALIAAGLVDEVIKCGGAGYKVSGSPSFDFNAYNHIPAKVQAKFHIFPLLNVNFCMSYA